VLERGEVANSWRHERWDSLRLLTPNWQCRLPGVRYEGPDPDGYMTAAEVVELIERFAEPARARVRTGTNVTSVRRVGDGYQVTTTDGKIQCRTVVIASGACNRPTVPDFADAVPANVEQLTTFTFNLLAEARQPLTDVVFDFHCLNVDGGAPVTSSMVRFGGGGFSTIPAHRSSSRSTTNGGTNALICCRAASGVSSS